MKKLYYLIGICLSTQLCAQNIPDTEIYLASLTNNNGKIKLENPKNITQHKGYDNQPSFTPDGKKVLFTAMQLDGQTDIFAYDLKKKTTSQLTQTPESEYSATVTPDGKHFSVIRVEADKTQRLWQFDLVSGKNPTLVLPNIKPVGYHCWWGADSLVLFVLGESNTLQLASVSTDKSQIITNNIGRSLHRIPNQKAISFIHKISPTEWYVEKLNLPSLHIQQLIQTPEGSEDCVWLKDGTLLMAKGTKLFQWKAENDKDWQEIADFEALGIKQITRLAVNIKNNLLTFVAQ